jgi:hypothetical protein
MIYKTEYNLDDEWHGDLWLGETPIPISLKSYSIGNDSYRDCFGVVCLPDYIEDMEWEVEIDKINPVWLKKYTVKELEKMVNQDEIFFDMEVVKVLKALQKDAEEI